jgi:hypothetical protein
MQERGRVVIEGKTGAFTDSVGVQGIAFIILLGFLVFIAALVVRSIQGHTTVLGSNVLAAVTLSLFGGFFLVIMNLIGFETNRIYENGVTTGTTTLIQFLRGESFQAFDRIDRVGIGRVTIKGFVKDSEFIVLFDRERGQTLRPFISSSYRDDFYRALVWMLEQKCPEVTWTQIRWEDLKRR